MLNFESGDIITGGQNKTAESQQTLRILFLTRWLTSEKGGGVQTYLCMATAALDKYPITLDYAALMPGSAPPYVRGQSHLGKRGLPKPLNALRLCHWLAHHLAQIDVVYIHGILDWHFIVGAILSRWFKTPYIAKPAAGLLAPTAHGPIEHRPKSKLYFAVIGKRLLRRARFISVGSAAEADSIRRISGNLDIRLLPQGTTLSSEPGARLNRNNDSDELRILFMGRFIPSKGIPLLFESINRICLDGTKVRLLLAGSGNSDYTNDLRQTAKQLSIQDKIEWRGYVSGSAKEQLIQTADVLVLPSYGENFGFVVAEAASAGLPAVVSDGVGIADVVRRYGSGSVFSNGDASDLTQALTRYQDKAFRLEKAKQAYACARAEFSLEAMGRGLYKLCTEAAKSRRLPGRDYP